MIFMNCWKCGKDIALDQVYRTTECPDCHADLHSCKGCRFYEQGSHYDCKETVDSPVTDKERANFCDFFMVRTIRPLRQAQGPEQALGQGSENGLEQGTEDAATKARNAFNSLFGD